MVQRRCVRCCCTAVQHVLTARALILGGLLLHDRVHHPTPQGEDFDFCCPSAPDDLFARVSYTEKSGSNEDGEQQTQRENKSPLTGLLNLMGF